MTRGKVYLAIQAAACIALVLLMIVSTVAIWREGSARKAEDPTESVYTPEIVAEKLAPIAPLFFAGVGLLIAGLVLGVKDENAEKPVKDAKIVRDPAVANLPRMKEEKAQGAAPEPKASGKTRRNGTIQTVIVVVAVILIIAGAFNGSARDVLYKAITICTECVGLG